MKFHIYVQDLPDTWIARSREVLAQDLRDEIEDAVESGVEREVAEKRVVDGYLNRRNVGWELEI